MRPLPIIAILIALCGCSPKTVYVPIETVRTEYKEADTAAVYNRLKTLVESVYQREVSSDSVIDRQKETVVLTADGDTARHDRERIVFVASHREQELEHRVSEQDSVITALRLQLTSVKSDSVPVPYPVERKLGRWEQAKQDYGGWAMGLLITVLCAVVVWIARAFRRR